ncbi:MAG TPA: response regulator transcription factor [Armatimonadota bacterium]|jgi:DNA-binding response OmpR family regulator
MARILLLSRKLGDLDRVRSLLNGEGHQVALCDLEEASVLRAVEERRPDLMLLHCNGSKPEVVRLRTLVRGPSASEDVGLILLTTSESLPLLDPSEKVDDLAVAPYGDDELLFRVRVALLRRSPTEEASLLQVDEMVIDVANYSVSLRGEPLDLTYKEYQLLKFLVSHPSRVFTRDALLTQVWGYDYYGGTRTVDVHIRRIRAKLGSPYDRLVETVHNVGYKFSTPRTKSGS